jgi:hypothetical protein
VPQVLNVKRNWREDDVNLLQAQQAEPATPMYVRTAQFRYRLRIPIVAGRLQLSKSVLVVQLIAEG